MIKPKLDTGVEVYDKKVKKNQRHATNEKPNMYSDIFNKKFQLTIDFPAVELPSRKVDILFPIPENMPLD